MASRKRRMGLWLGLVSAVLSGCLASGPARSAGTLRKGFVPNILAWHVPLDDYAVNQNDDTVANALLYNNCMASHGYTDRSPDGGDIQSPVRNGTSWRLFNVPIAERYGYHATSVPIPERLPISRAMSSREVAQSGACSGASRAELKENHDLANAVSGLAWEADDQAQADAKVKAAVERWRNCVLPLGIPDLPEFPSNAATKSQRIRFGLSVGPPQEGKPLPPIGTASAAEIKEAVFDAKCRDSSGFSEAYYQATVNYQFALMAKHQDLLARAMAAKQATEAAIAKVLKANGR